LIIEVIMTEIVAYELQIAGSREDAERAAREHGVTIRIIPESPNNGKEVWAICARADVGKILKWHDVAMPWLQAGNEPTPGMLVRISQPPEGETLEGPTSDEIVGYELWITGTREDAKKAATEHGVTIRILSVSPDDGRVVWAICPKEDLAKILEWRLKDMPLLRGGHRPRPGMLLLVYPPLEGTDENEPPLIDPNYPVRFDEL
jgi:hypothetical protein